MSKKDLFESLQENNKPTGAKPTKLNENKLNNLVDTISPTVKPELSSDESLFTSLERSQNKRGGKS